MPAAAEGRMSAADAVAMLASFTIFTLDATSFLKYRRKELPAGQTVIVAATISSEVTMSGSAQIRVGVNSFFRCATLRSPGRGEPTLSEGSPYELEPGFMAGLFLFLDDKS